MFILTIISIMIFIPIPIKISGYFNKNHYYLKVYNINIYSNKNCLIKSINKFKEKHFNKTKKKVENLKNKKNIKKPKIKKHIISKKKLLISIFNKIHNNKFKPTLSLKCNLNYSLNDAFLTAISYGFINNIQPILFIFFNIIFKIKNLNLNFIPNFTKDKIFNVDFKLTIKFSLFKIFYLILMIFICFINSREVNPKWGKV